MEASKKYSSRLLGFHSLGGSFGSRRQAAVPCIDRTTVDSSVGVSFKSPSGHILGPHKGHSRLCWRLDVG